MKLTPFIDSLFRQGSVIVGSDFDPFESSDVEQAVGLLMKIHEREKLEMPLTAPAFHPAAAAWAMNYLYRAVQLIMLRDKGEETIREQLSSFEGEITPDAIFTVDLVFRFLPDLLKLSKGLAPGDPLVQQLKQEAEKWPFSSAGMENANAINDEMILQHPSLRYAYMDRIMRMKDKTRLNKPELAALANEVMGGHADVFWPGLELQAQLNTNDN